MNIQEHSESIANQRQCHNAKPPINHDIKYAQELEISADVARFLASGREIEQVASKGTKPKVLTYKEVNDSYYGVGL